MDADPVGRDRAEDARPTDLEGEVGRELICERRGAKDRGKRCEADLLCEARYIAGV